MKLASFSGAFNAAFSIIAALVWAAPVSGVPVDPGTTVPLSGIYVTPNSDRAGTVIRDKFIPFKVTNRKGQVLMTGNLQDRVVRSNNLGSMVFCPRLCDLTLPSGPAWIGMVRVQGYTGAIIDVDFSLSGVGDIGPNDVTRSADGATLDFRHDPHLIVPPDEQRFLSIVSDAQDYQLTGSVTIYVYNDFGGESYRTTISGTACPDRLNVHPDGSIQWAIDHANPGETVQVMPGVYNENLHLRSTVDVAGSGPGRTILNGLGDSDVVHAENITDCTFSGFTVANSANDRGGFYLKNGAPVIRGNEVRDCGFGVILTNGSSALICANWIHDTGVSDALGHSAVVISRSRPMVAGNLIVANEGGFQISGIESSDAYVANNTIVGNLYSGIWCTLDASPDVKNNIISDNESGVFAETGSFPVLTFNNFWNNDQNYYSHGGSAVPGIGSISVDPEFDEEYPEDYRLALGSPCIDAGDPDPIYNDPDGSRNDMGAYGGACAMAPLTESTFANGFLFTSVGKIPTSEITKSGSDIGLANVSESVASSLSIHQYKDSPFGGRPWLYGAFGVARDDVALYTIGIGQWSGGTPPTSLDFVDHPLGKVRYTISGGVISAQNVSVGPFFQSGVPYYLRTVNSASVIWAHEDLVYILNTLRLPDGLYDIGLRGYTSGGLAEVTLDPNPRLTVMVNNQIPVVEIIDVSLDDGTVIPECGIIRLEDPEDNLRFRLTAIHPDGYLYNYSCTSLYGRNHYGGVITSDQYAGSHDSPGPLWTGITNEIVNTAPAMASSALDPWISCAYQFHLVAWARTTDGFTRIYRSVFNDHYAISLEGPASTPSPDLDGDGDVDGDDLRIFAEAYGTTGD